MRKIFLMFKIKQSAFLTPEHNLVFIAVNQKAIQDQMAF